MLSRFKASPPSISPLTWRARRQFSGVLELPQVWHLERDRRLGAGYEPFLPLYALSTVAEEDEFLERSRRLTGLAQRLQALSLSTIGHGAGGIGDRRSEARGLSMLHGPQAEDPQQQDGHVGDLYHVRAAPLLHQQGGLASTGIWGHIHTSPRRCWQSWRRP